jgi:hypothetical protein
MYNESYDESKRFRVENFTSDDDVVALMMDELSRILNVHRLYRVDSIEERFYCRSIIDAYVTKVVESRRLYFVQRLRRELDIGFEYKRIVDYREVMRAQSVTYEIGSDCCYLNFNVKHGVGLKPQKRDCDFRSAPIPITRIVEAYNDIRNRYIEENDGVFPEGSKISDVILRDIKLELDKTCTIFDKAVKHEEQSPEFDDRTSPQELVAILIEDHMRVRDNRKLIAKILAYILESMQVGYIVWLERDLAAKNKTSESEKTVKPLKRVNYGNKNRNKKRRGKRRDFKTKIYINTKS